jgi:ketosteroid isomerase-like protein
MSLAAAESDLSTNPLVAGFAATWAAPSLDGFLRLFTTDVVLRAPLTEPSTGIDAAREEFARLLYVWPDVHGVVDRWSASGDAVFIEWRLQGRFANRALSFRVVDRIIERDGKIADREMFADGFAIAEAFLRSPTQWPRMWRSGLAPARWLRRAMRGTTSWRRFATRTGIR